MAKKTIPDAIKNASNIKNDFGDFGELDSWESDLENFNFDESVNFSDRKPKGVVREGLTEVFKSALKGLAPSIARKTKEKIKSIDTLINDSSEIIDETKYLKEQFSSDITPTLNTLKQTGRVLNSKLKGTIPDSLSDRLEKLFKSEEQEYQNRELTKEEIENNTIKDSLNAIYLEQAKYQEEKDKRDSQDKFLEKSLDKYRHDQLSQLLDQIRINTASERLFRKSTYTSYLKKDLELKYKHLFVAKELLATQQASAKIFENKFNILIKNSTLPDIQKKRMSESAKEMVLNTLGGNFANYGSSVIKKLIQNAKNQSKDFSNQAGFFTSMLNMATNMSGMGTSPASMVGDMIGSEISNKLGTWIVNKLFGDQYGQNNQGLLKGDKDVLDLAGFSLQSRLSNKIRKMQISGNPFLSVFSSDQKELSVTNKLSGNPNDDASWDNASRTSLVYIIPQYLARILQQITNIATGQQNPLLLYSPVQNKLVEQKQLQKDFTINILGNDKKRGEKTGKLIGSLKAAYQRSNKLNKEDTDKIFKDNDELLKQVLYNIDKYKVYPDEKLLKSFINNDDNNNKEIRDVLIGKIFEGITDRDDQIKIAKLLLQTTSGSNKDNSTFAVKQNIDKAYSEFLNAYSDRSKETLDKFSSFGYQEELGKLINTRNDRIFDRLEIDENMYKKAFMNAGTINGGISSGELEGRKVVNESVRGIRRSQRQEFHLANAIFNYLSGDFSEGNQEVVQFCKSINSILKEKGINLKDIKTILPGLKDLVLDGINQGAVTVESFISWLKETDKKQILNFKAHFNKAKQWFNQRSERIKNEKNEQKKKKEEEEKKLREYYNSLDTNQYSYNYLFSDDISGSDTSRPKILSNFSSKEIQSPTEKIVDAIKHFENTFIEYVDLSQDNNRTDYLAFSNEENISKSFSSKENKRVKFNEIISSIDKKKSTLLNKLNVFKESITNKDWIKRLATDSSIQTKVYNNIISGKIDSDPLVREVQNQFEDLKDNPNLIKENLSKLQNDFKIKYNNLTITDSDSKDNIHLTDGFNKVGTIARDILSNSEYEAMKNRANEVKVHTEKVYNKLENQSTSTYGKFKNKIVNTVKGLNKQKYIDIYPKEILQNPNVSPLVTAGQLEREECEFANGKLVPDAYSIDKRVYDRISGNILIDDKHINEGIYDRNGQEITKKSFAYKVGKATEKATSTALHSSLKLAGSGIKLGMKSLLFGMGLYGKMYWMMGKLGFNIAKGMAKGIFNLKTAKLLGKGVLGLAKGVFTGLRIANLLGTRALWGIGRGIGGFLGFNKSSKFMRGPEQSVFSKFLNISGIIKAKDSAKEFIKDKYDAASTLISNTKNKTIDTYNTAKDFVLGDENENGERTGGLVDDINNVKTNIIGGDGKESLYGRTKKNIHNFFSPINEENNNIENNKKETKKTIRDSRIVEEEEKKQGANEIFNDTLTSSTKKPVQVNSPTVTSYFDKKTPAERSADALEKLTELNKKDNKKGFFSKILSLLTGGVGILGALAKGLASFFGFDNLIDTALGAVDIAKGAWSIAKKGAGLVKKGAETLAKGAGNIVKKIAPSGMKQLATKLGSKFSLSGLTTAGLSGFGAMLTPLLGTWSIMEGMDFLAEMYEAYAKDKPNLITSEKVNKQLEENPAYTTDGEQISDVNALMDAAESGSLETLDFTKNDAGSYTNSNSGWDYNSNMSMEERIRQYNRTTSKNSGIDQSISDEAVNIKPMKFTPDPNELGALSARYESNGKPDAIGYDSTGGTSYGRFQIASQVGTFSNFVNWCEKNGGALGKEVAQRLRSAWGKSNGRGKFGNTGSRSGAIVTEWKKLASEGKIAPLEYAFIKATHYDKGLKNIKNPEVKKVIEENRILQEVLWSTSVQHGPGAISGIFDKAWNSSNTNLEQFVKNIYNIRGTKFGSSTPKVRASVKNRFKNELAIALNELKKGGGNPVVTTEQSTNALNPNASVSENAKEITNASGETLTSSAPNVNTETTTQTTQSTESSPVTSTTSDTQNNSSISENVNTTPQETSPSVETIPTSSNEQPEVKVNNPPIVDKSPAPEKKIDNSVAQEQKSNTTTPSSSNPILDILKQVVPLLETINTSISGVEKAVTSSSTEMTKIFMGSLPSSSSSSSSVPNRGSNSQRSYTPTIKTPRVQIDVAKAS